MATGEVDIREELRISPGQELLIERMQFRFSINKDLFMNYLDDRKENSSNIVKLDLIGSSVAVNLIPNIKKNYSFSR